MRGTHKATSKKTHTPGPAPSSGQAVRSKEVAGFTSTKPSAKPPEPPEPSHPPTKQPTNQGTSLRNKNGPRQKTRQHISSPNHPGNKSTTDQGTPGSNVNCCLSTRRNLLRQTATAADSGTHTHIQTHSVLVFPKGCGWGGGVFSSYMRIEVSALCTITSNLGHQCFATRPCPRQSTHAKRVLISQLVTQTAFSTGTCRLCSLLWARGAVFNTDGLRAKCLQWVSTPWQIAQLILEKSHDMDGERNLHRVNVQLR